tara:strand:- start:39568 stop:41928 length:2361 start_codon:yes stop_codon:yes gene_type:complete
LGLATKVRNSINKFYQLFLKGDFKVRYIIALSIIALLTIFQQMLVQISLESQVESFHYLEQSRGQIDRMNKLKLKILETQTLTNIKESKLKIKQAIANLNQLIADNKEYEHNSLFVISIGKAEKQYHRLLALLQRDLNSALESLEDDKDSQEVTANVFVLTEIITKYIKIFGDELDAYSIELSNRLDQLRLIELFISFFIILVLFFEALFIFAPALNRLKGAQQARSMFFSKVGHEIRNPMNSIIGMIDLIEKNITNENTLKYLERMRISSNGLLSFLNNIIEYASVENQKISLEYSNIDIKNLIIEITSLFYQEKDELKFYIYIADDMPRVIQSDYIKLKYIIINLLSNAFKFTEKGTIKLLMEYSDKTLIIKVIDTGIGISDERLKDIFDEFTQEESSTKRVYGGTGLGLTIIKEYVDLMSGRVLVTSKKGFGSEFKVSIPMDFVSDKSLKTKIYDGLVYVYQDQDLADWARFYFKKNVICFNVFDEKIKESTENSIILSNDYTPFKLSSDHRVVINKSSTKNIENTTHTFIYPLLPWDLSLKTNKIKVPQSHKLDTELNVLICDDMPDNRDILCEHLKEFFQNVSTVSSGKECLEYVQKYPVDILFLDINMPDMSGFDVIKVLNKKFPKLKTIAFTAYNSHNELKAMQKAGFNSVLNKPINRAKLIDVIYQHIDPLKDNISDDFEKRVRLKLLEKRNDFLKSILMRLENIINSNYDNLDEFRNDVKKLGHNLKGTGSSYGADELSEKGAFIELSSQDVSKEEMLKVLEKLYKEIESLLDGTSE